MSSNSAMVFGFVREKELGRPRLLLFPACHSRRALYHESAASSACRLPRRAVRVFEEPVSVLQRCYMTGSIAHPAEAVRVSRTGALLIVRFRLERRAALSHSVPLVRLRHGRGRAFQGSGSRLRSPRAFRGDPLRGPSNPSAVRWVDGTAVVQRHISHPNDKPCAHPKIGKPYRL